MNNWRQCLRAVVPYVPGEQPQCASMIKLNTNENPYPPSPSVYEAAKRFDAGTLRLYPDPTSHCLTSALASYYHVNENQVFVGVGSDDVLALSFLTFFNSKKPILFPDITYSFYEVWADLYRIPYETKALDDQFHLKREDYCQENGGIIFPNPNAPTGLLESIEDIEYIVKRNPDAIVIVDEAYIDFGGTSALPLVDQYDNLLVVQTFSKSRSMAGQRIGFAIGQPELIKYLQNVKYSFNSYTMNQTSQYFGAAALADEEYFQETVQKIITTRERAKKELAALGFTFADSMANFIFAKHNEIKAEKLFQDLRQSNIFVRYFKKPRIDDYLRITIGTDQEMDALFSFLKRYQ